MSGGLFPIHSPATPPPKAPFLSPLPPQLVMSPAASDVKVSQAEGTMQRGENVNVTHILAAHMCARPVLLTGY